jgi:hypothetical protein
MKKFVIDDTVPKCDKCGKTVKPDVVLVSILNFIESRKHILSKEPKILSLVKVYLMDLVKVGLIFQNAIWYF